MTHWQVGAVYGFCNWDPIDPVGQSETGERGTNMGCGRSGDNENELPIRATCPANGQLYQRVGRRTVLHQVQKPWKWSLPDQGYYFCTDPDCDVVYFGQDGSVIGSGEIRCSVGQKRRDPERTLCYCFDITHADLLASQGPSAESPCKAFVIEQTRQSACDCEIRNPSGRCCLGEFTKQ
jgi:hypothetical protein